jgi:tRNA dimethylallyltransferase
VAGIESRRHRALLVGGTGLYFQALVDGLEPPGRYPALKSELETEDTPSLYARLTALDPVAAARMEPSNRRRVIRALEVTVGSGRLFSSYGPGMTSFPESDWDVAGLWLPRAVVAARIGVRLAEMIEDGLVAEVEGLLARPGGMSRTARQALGYHEVLEHLELGTPLSTAVAEAERRTRAFARRQRMWWRRDPRIRWYGAVDNPFAVMAQLLGDWKVR